MAYRLKENVGSEAHYRLGSDSFDVADSRTGAASDEPNSKQNMGQNRQNYGYSYLLLQSALVVAVGLLFGMALEKSRGITAISKVI